MSGDLEFNKIAGAVLATALAFLGVKELAHAAYHPHMPEIPAYGADIQAAAEAAAASGGAEEVILPFPQPEWIAAMDATRGETVAKKCVACHSFEKGAANGVGPALWNKVGMVAASKPDFNYSVAMKDSGITWDFETLDAYLERPSRYVKGTNMTFVGLKKPEDRAAMIEYMRVSADSPLAQPDPAPMPIEEEILEEIAEDADGEVTDLVETPAAPEDAPVEPQE